LIIARPLQIHSLPRYKIFAKSIYLLLSYGDFNIYNLGADPTFDFMIDGFQSPHNLYFMQTLNAPITVPPLLI